MTSLSGVYINKDVVMSKNIKNYLKLIYVTDQVETLENHEVGKWLNSNQLLVDKFMELFMSMFIDMNINKDILECNSISKIRTYDNTLMSDSNKLIMLIELIYYDEQVNNQYTLPIIFNSSNFGSTVHVSSDKLKAEAIGCELNELFVKELLTYEVDFSTIVSKSDSTNEYILYPLSGVPIYDAIMNNYIHPLSISNGN
jgi:hypothetical protein